MTTATPTRTRQEPFPGGIHLGIASAGMVALACVLAMTTEQGQVTRLLAMAMAAGFAAALIPDRRFAAGAGLIGYLIYVGFMVNQYGELSWSGKESLWQLTIFVLAYWIGLGQRWMRLR